MTGDGGIGGDVDDDNKVTRSASAAAPTTAVSTGLAVAVPFAEFEIPSEGRPNDDDVAGMVLVVAGVTPTVVLSLRNTELGLPLLLLLLKTETTHLLVVVIVAVRSSVMVVVAVVMISPGLFSASFNSAGMTTSSLVSCCCWPNPPCSGSG